MKITEDAWLIFGFIVGMILYALAFSINCTKNGTWNDQLPVIESPQPQEMMD